jgi:hypothetical protein
MEHGDVKKRFEGMNDVVIKHKNEALCSTNVALISAISPFFYSNFYGNCSGMKQTKEVYNGKEMTVLNLELEQEGEEIKRNIEYIIQVSYEKTTPIFEEPFALLSLIVFANFIEYVYMERIYEIFFRMIPMIISPSDKDLQLKTQEELQDTIGETVRVKLELISCIEIMYKNNKIGMYKACFLANWIIFGAVNRFSQFGIEHVLDEMKKQLESSRRDIISMIYTRSLMTRPYALPSSFNPAESIRDFFRVIPFSRTIETYIFNKKASGTPISKCTLGKDISFSVDAVSKDSKYHLITMTFELNDSKITSGTNGIDELCIYNAYNSITEIDLHDRDLIKTFAIINTNGIYTEGNIRIRCDKLEMQSGNFKRTIEVEIYPLSQSTNINFFMSRITVLPEEVKENQKISYCEYHPLYACCSEEPVMLFDCDIGAKEWRASTEKKRKRYRMVATNFNANVL